MTQNYEIRIGKYLQDAWQNFIKAPEIYITITLAYLVCQWVFGYIPLAGNLLSLAAALLICPALLITAHKTHERGKGSFEDLKEIFPFIPQLVVLALISFIIIMLGFLILILPGIYFVVAYAFANQFVLFKGQAFWPALESSRKLVNQSWFAVFGLIFVVFCVAMVGILALGVGLLVSIPVAQIMVYYAFRDIQQQIGQA